MRSKKQKIEAVMATRDLLAELSVRQGCAYRGVPNPLRTTVKSLLRQFPTEAELRAALEAGLQDSSPPPKVRTSWTDWVRRQYSSTDSTARPDS